MTANDLNEPGLTSLYSLATERNNAGAMHSEGACQRCKTANVASARFCMSCGAPLVAVCSTCGTQIESGARFCIGCGASLERNYAAGDPNEERRTVTVLFADLVGYTSLAERLDHESVKALTDRCLTRLAREVEHFGGYVDQYIGDNVMAVFGAPIAHEDDAERAIRAGCGMQRAMSELNQSIGPEFGVELALRVGVNTGDALAGRVGGQYTVVGDAVNVAARLQGAAPVGGVLVGERTRSSCASAAEFRELGRLTLKGKADAVKAWEVLELRDPGGLPAPGRSRTPLVGRHAEKAQLQALFEIAARNGTAHLVTVLGEAGVGKTRLVEETQRMLRESATDFDALCGRCHAFGSGSYTALVELLRKECSIGPVDGPEQVRSKLALRFGPSVAAAEGAGQAEARLAPLAQVLLADRAEGEPMPSERDQREAREGFLGAVRAVLEALAAQRPLLIVWEDVHWADEGTLELIEYLARWLAAPVMQVCLAREDLLERRPAWGSARGATTSMFLEPLSLAETRQLIDELARDSSAVIDTPETLAARSGGNALFAEALVDRFMDEGAAGVGRLPDTVQGLLAARLDSLAGRERRLIGHAAVFGRSFSEETLEPLAGEGVLSTSLESLCAKNLIAAVDPSQPEGRREYVFKHVLIRDAAYETLPMAVRARRHAEIGSLIERREGEQAASLLADHLVRAASLAERAHLPAPELSELRGRAVRFSEAAGDAAVALYTNEEALTHYRTAVSLAEPGDHTELRLAERIGELELRLGRAGKAVEEWEHCLEAHAESGDAKHAALLHGRIAAAHVQQGEIDSAMKQLRAGIGLLEEGPASLELIRLYEEAAALYDRLGNDVLAIYACERALRLAKGLGEPRVTSRALAVLGRLFGRMGDSEKARQNLARAVELARGSDPSEAVVALLASGSNREENEGDYAGAEATYLEALELAERIGDVPAQIEIISALAKIAFYRCDWHEAEVACESSARLAEREGLVGRLCLAQSLQGQLRWREGDWDGSEQLFARAHDLARRASWAEACNAALVGRAATLRDRGDLDGAESALRDAVAICERGALLAPSIHAHSALTLTRALAGRSAQAQLSAAEAVRLGRRVHDPAARLAALEARGLIAGPDGACDAFAQARSGWTSLGRPLDAARCAMLLGRSLLAEDPRAADRTLSEAADVFEQLGVAHMAYQSRNLQPA